MLVQFDSKNCYLISYLYTVIHYTNHHHLLSTHNMYRHVCIPSGVYMVSQIPIKHGMGQWQFFKRLCKWFFDLVWSLDVSSARCKRIFLFIFLMHIFVLKWNEKFSLTNIVAVLLHYLSCRNVAEHHTTFCRITVHRRYILGDEC